MFKALKIYQWLLLISVFCILICNSSIFAEVKICSEVEFFITPVEERISTRSFPSVWQFGYPIWNEDTPYWDRFNDPELFAYHDLVVLDFILYPSYLDFYHKDWEGSTSLRSEPYGLATDIIIDVERTKARYDYYHSRNPNFVYLLGWTFYAEKSAAFPDDDFYWMLDAEGNRIEWGNPDSFIVNFLNPEVQEIIIEQAVGIASCGIFDGIHIDQFTRDGAGVIHRGRAPVSDAEIREALVHIFSEIRDRVPDDFLIMVNSGTEVQSAPVSFTEYINGIQLHSVRDRGKPYDVDYLMEIEGTLLWAENNLRSPQINGVEGFGLETEHPNGLNNQKWMRVLTTLTLTHSNGFIVYNIGASYSSEPLHAEEGHYWYDFYDADLGRPVGGAETKGQLYDNRDGVFIREFTNGWAVYNRSGKEQQIQLPESTTGFSSGIKADSHTLADLDGEIYLKAPGKVADLNSDGIVNILDLVIIANALGKTAPDLNGDGIVNILDLVIVANAFSG